MKRPLSDYRPLGPFFGSYETMAPEESRAGGHIIMEFISGDHNDDNIQDIQNDVLMFSERVKTKAYPGGRTSIVVNTNLNRLDIDQMIEVHNIFNPQGDELVKLSAEPSIEQPDDELILAQNDLIVALGEKVQKRKLSKEVTHEIGATSIDVYDPDNIVEGAISYGSMFKITEPDTLSEAIRVYDAVEGEFLVERMFLQPFMY